jgi:hypothetical protein
LGVINDHVLSRPNPVWLVLQSFREMAGGEEKDQPPREPCILSPREAEILEHIGRGNSNKEIAKLLAISDQTVKNHITSLLRKLARQRPYRSRGLCHQKPLDSGRFITERRWRIPERTKTPLSRDARVTCRWFAGPYCLLR